MSNGFDTEADAGGGPSPPPGDAGSAQGPGGPPPDGSGVMAALANKFQGPQPSAPGMGDMAGAMNDIHQAIKLMQGAAMRLPAGSPLWKDAQKAVQNLGRHIPQGAPAEGVQKTSLLDQVRALMQNMFRGRAMQQMQQGQQGGGQPQPPAPTTPLPGA